MKLGQICESSDQTIGGQGFNGSFFHACRGFFNTLVAACVVVGALGTAQGVQAENLRLAHFMSPQHVMHQEMMKPWAERVSEKTDGELTVEIFPARQLGGSPPAQYNMAVDGIADIAFGLQGYTASNFPLTTVSELPGFASDASDATAKLWTLWDDYLKQEYRDTKPLAIWTADINVIVSRDKPIRTLEDLEGMEVRTPSRFSGAVIKALGATPVSMPVTEMYTSLERGVVDAVMIPASAVESFELLEVANYITTEAPLGFSPYFLAMNKGAYEGLPDDLRQSLDQTIGEPLSETGADGYAGERAAVMFSIRGSEDVEMVSISEDERQRWLSAVEPAVERWLELAEEGGVRSEAEEMLQQLGIE